MVGTGHDTRPDPSERDFCLHAIPELALPAVTLAATGTSLLLLLLDLPHISDPYASQKLVAPTVIAGLDTS
jgi:hypothetical protein